MPKYKQSNQEFINPYNFISMGNSPSRASLLKGKLTGWIECELTNKTPLFIPNTSNDDVFGIRANNKEVKSYDFFSYTDLKNTTNPNPPANPVIPGSSIRGAIRSAFEAITNSCMSAVDLKGTLYKRTVKAGQAGRLYKANGQWKIQKCERYGINTRGGNRDTNGPFDINDYTEGQEVYVSSNGNYTKTLNNGHTITLFKVVSNICSNQMQVCTKMGYFHKGEPFGHRKHHESVFVPTNGAELNIPEETVTNLKKNLELYRDDKINQKKKNRDHSGYKDFKIEESGTLVYYNSDGNGKYYLSPSAISREIFYKNMENIIGDYAPCRSTDNLCPACALFGFVSDEKEKNALASRVRFSDAELCTEQNNLFGAPQTLPELSSPKLSASEFYLKKPDGADDWNYDYKVMSAGNNQVRRPYCAEIRGRKFYWHKQISACPSGGAVTERNVHIRPLNPEKKFVFKVYFSKLTESELQRLVWVLEIGNNEANAHKIGMGKPLGLGSVKITVTNVMRRQIKPVEDGLIYEVQPYDNCRFTGNNVWGEPGCSQSTYNEFLRITNYAQSSTEIAYPSNEGSDRTYEWFGANRSYNTTATKPKINQVLPNITAQVINLRKYRRQH